MMAAVKQERGGATAEVSFEEGTKQSNLKQIIHKWLSNFIINVLVSRDVTAP
jgi:hypothetical protein